MAIVGRPESADWIIVEISNMFNTGSPPTVMKLVVELADSGLLSADPSADSSADPAKVGVWVRAFIHRTNLIIVILFPIIVHYRHFQPRRVSKQTRGSGGSWQVLPPPPEPNTGVTWQVSEDSRWPDQSGPTQNHHVVWYSLLLWVGINFTYIFILLHHMGPLTLEFDRAARLFLKFNRRHWTFLRLMDFFFK